MTIKLIECEKDGFPILNINGEQQCLAEFMDHCLGRKKITDVVKRTGTLYYVFENGHELPILCYCCGEPRDCPDLQAEHKHMRGRIMKAMTWTTKQLQQGGEVIDFRMKFSLKAGEEEAIIVQTSVISAEELHHPAACCHSGLPATTSRALPRLANVSPPSKKRRRR